MPNICKICLDSETSDNVLFRPCVCNDYVHKNCLNKWRNETVNPYNFITCTVCKKKFATRKFRTLNDEELKTMQKYKRSKTIKFVLSFLSLIFLLLLFVHLSTQVMDYGYTIPTSVKWVFVSFVNGQVVNETITKSWENEFTESEASCYYLLYSLFVLSASTAMAKFSHDRIKTFNRFECNCESCFVLFVLTLVLCLVDLMFILIIYGCICSGSLTAVVGIFFIMIGTIIYAIVKVTDCILSYCEIVEQYFLEKFSVEEICDRDHFDLNLEKSVEKLPYSESRKYTLPEQVV